LRRLLIEHYSFGITSNLSNSSLFLDILGAWRFRNAGSSTIIFCFEMDLEMDLGFGFLFGRFVKVAGDRRTLKIGLYRSVSTLDAFEFDKL